MSSVQWGDVPTWVTAVATIAAAVGAFIAARIAFRQLKGQRAEIERQAGEQGRLADLQTKQLAQLDQQATLNALQIARLDAQSAQLRRSQAVQIDLRRVAQVTYIHGPGSFEGINVVNASDRPIREVAARMVTVQASPGAATATGSLVAPHAQRFSPFVGDPASNQPDENTLDPSRPLALIRSGQTAYIVWPYAAETPGLTARIRFTDDAGVRWELDQDMHLAEQPDEEW